MGGSSCTSRALVALAALAGCRAPDTGGPDLVGERIGDTTLVATAGGPADTVTIAGRIFYNDRRDFGLFPTRRDRDGAVGVPCGLDGVRDDGTDCEVNYLGGYGMVVDIYERDDEDTVFTAACRKEERLASATVLDDGTFVATFPPDDACDGDTWSEPAILLSVRLRQCEGTCFSINQAVDDAYALFHPDAPRAAPLLVEPGTTYRLSDMGFFAADTDPAEPSDLAVAANYFASAVDVLETVHDEAGVPFFAETFGEVQYVYPSDATPSATTLSATEVALGPRPGWVEGGLIAHEYGHVLMLRAWDGGYGWDGVGVRWNVNEAMEPRVAFKEGWANFVSRAVFTASLGCAGVDFDDNEAWPLVGPAGEGSAWVTDVNKLLCDWHDTRDDDDPAMPGPGDSFADDDLSSVWSNLRGMYQASDPDAFEAGLSLCDWVAYYLDVRQSAAGVGESAHDASVEQIGALLEQNNIACEAAR